MKKHDGSVGVPVRPVKSMIYFPIISQTTDMMNLAHWRLLVTIAETGNVSRAAERVGITQSGASQAVTQLEAALGVQVFARSRREVTVTALGEKVVEHARAMLLQLDAIRVLADDSRGLNQGRIRLGSFPSVISTLLPSLTRTFRQRHPGIEIVALEGTDEEVEDWLASDAIDLGVVLNPTAERNALILGRDAWMGLVPSTHPLGRRATIQGIALSELATQPFILATGGCAVNGQRLVESAGLKLVDDPDHGQGLGQCVRVGSRRYGCCPGASVDLARRHAEPARFAFNSWDPSGVRIGAFAGRPELPRSIRVLGSDRLEHLMYPKRAAATLAH